MMDVLECFQATMKTFTPLKPFLVGESLTIADISIFYTLTLLDVIESRVDWNKIPKVRQFMDAMDAGLKRYDTDGYFKIARENMVAVAKLRQT